MTWTADKIAMLAPDSSTERRGRGLANKSHWLTLGSNGRALWGECKGSGSQPYQTQIDITGPAFKCTCPISKPPCKHALGLFFLYAQQENLFNNAQTPIPTWVQDWLDKRDARLAAKNEPKEVKTPEALEKSQKAKEKRWEKRLDLMQSGIEELELWMLDLVRQGFANVDIMESNFWNKTAARMVDAKMPRLSSFLKETCFQIQTQTNWTEILTARLGELFLLVQAFHNRTQLSEKQLDELFNSVGLNVQKSEVLEENPAIDDTWLVLARKEAVDIEGIPYRKIWLQGVQNQQYALLLDFTFGGKGYEQHYVVGTQLSGKLTYYPAAHPQRALIPQFQVLTQILDNQHIKYYDSIESMLKTYSQVLAFNPWLPNFLVALGSVTPLQTSQGMFLRDEQDMLLPITSSFSNYWYRLLALSGGHSVAVIGEWNGDTFEPLSIWNASQQQLIEAQDQVLVESTRVMYED